MKIINEKYEAPSIEIVETVSRCFVCASVTNEEYEDPEDFDW